MNALLEVQELRSGYGRVPVLHGLDCNVAPGEIVGILGHNGMGKTTFLKTLIGAVPATGGSVRFGGVDITHLKSNARARAGIGYVPQGRGIFPDISVMDNLLMGVVALTRGDTAQRLDAMLEEFPQLKPLLDRRGGALSGGEQQLLALARCLISDPKMVLLDEPTEGIQPSIVDLIREKLAELAKARHLTVLFAEQNLEFIHALSDRIVTLQKGVIVNEVNAAEIDRAALIEEFTGF